MEDENKITATDPILWINAPSIGFKYPKMANPIDIIFKNTDYIDRQARKREAEKNDKK